MRRVVRCLPAAALCLTLATPLSAWAAPTLEALLSRPMTSNLVAAEAAQRIAWVETVRGGRSLWTASGPEFEPVLRVEYPVDDGQPVGGLQLTRDGSVLIYVRGSAPNAAGEIANPASDPGGVERAIWAVDTTSGEPWKVAAGAGPALSPDGRTVFYSAGKQIFEVPLRPPAEEEQGAPVEPLFQARGGLGGLAVSPDGASVGFVSDRGDHAFVGVFHREPARIVWMDPGVDRDGPLTWSPDGGSLAWLRLPGLRIGQRFDLTSAPEFSIRVGDPATGAARTVWNSGPEAGGFAQFYPPTSLAWAADDRLVFTAEERGWHHAYSLNVTSGEVVDLTPGAAEIEGFRLSPDGVQVLFWGNHGDVDRRHVWRVPATGGAPLRLTVGDGIEAEPTALPDSSVAIRYASAHTPMAIGVVPPAGGRIRLVGPALSDALRATFDELVEPEQVIFEAADGVRVHGQLFLPPGASETSTLPAVIFMHGGPIRQMLLGWHYSGYYANAYAFNQFLAGRGYAVLAVNFRTGIGYGRNFRRAESQGPRGASEYQDIVAAGRFLQARAEVDPERIGLWGGSYGGYLTAMGLARDSDLFAAGVDLHGVHDWAFRGSDFPLPGGAWGLTEDDAELARASSPVADVDTWTSPVLFVHGDDDRNVMFIQTTDLVLRLRERNVPVELLILPDEVHGFYRYESWLRTFQAAFDFFERRLRRR